MTTARDAHRTASVVRPAAVLCLGVGAVSAVVSLVVAGAQGLYGALLGTVLVLAFFSLGQLVLTMLRSIEPGMFLVIALLTYLFQVVCLLAVFTTFASWADGVSATALGVTIIVGTVAWTVGLVHASRRQRIPLFDLGGEAR